MNCFLLYEIGFHSGANSCRYRLKLNSKISHFLFSTPEGKSPWNHNLIINEKDNMSEQNEIKQNWDSSDLNFYCQGKKSFFLEEFGWQKVSETVIETGRLCWDLCGFLGRWNFNAFKLVFKNPWIVLKLFHQKPLTPQSLISKMI